MKRKPKAAVGAAELRQRAEARLRKQERTPPSTPDAGRLVHELQVHQVELEMQNAELKDARDQMESMLERYTDLYDFAPVGYFSLDEHGRILELNLRGASQLGVERAGVINRLFQYFVVPDSRPVFLEFWARLFAGGGKQICEIALRNEECTPFWAELRAASAASQRDAARWCRVAVSDISSRKREEEARRNSKVLTAANRELSREITRRQAVETVLKRREQQQAELLETSVHLQAQLRHQSHRILRAQEAERKRISRELHDEITQILVGINVRLTSLAEATTGNPSELKKRIAQTQRLVEKSVDIVHKFARELRPTALDDLGLIAALESHLTEFKQSTGLHVHFATFAEVDELSSDDRTVIYRVVQSALANVARHAHANEVRVSIRKQGGTVRLEVSDNGKSFDVARVLNIRTNRRLGVLGMRERVEMIGGTFGIESTPDRGTTVSAEIPIRSRGGSVPPLAPRPAA